MRVALLTTNMALGGAEAQVAALAATLKSRQWDVHVVSLIPPTAFVSELKTAGIPLHSPGVTGAPLLLRRLRPQILHCHMYHANLLGRVLRLFMPFPAVISTIHSMAESSRRSGRIVWRDRMYRLTDALADCNVAVSQAVADRHLEARAAKKIEVIPNGVDTTRFRPDAGARAQIRKALGIGDEFVFLAVGRLMWKKDYPALLRAFAQAQCGRLLIAGAGPQEEELRAMAGANVTFLGARDDIPALLNGADAYVLTSVVEGLPVALLEAAATGLPCLATDVGGVGETGAAMLVTRESLAGEMVRIAKLSKDARAAMGRKAREIVVERYSIGKTASTWEELYRRLARWT